jgi:hypothetical protein
MLGLLSLLCVTLVFLLALHPNSAHAYGEIFSFKVPEEIPEGDDVGIIVTASLKETNYDRGVVIDFPSGWKIKRAYAVVAGTTEVLGLPQSSDLADLYPSEKGRSLAVFADTNSWYGDDAAGIAYFVVFATKPMPQSSATIRTALVERIDPSSPPQINPKTKKPIARNTSWKMAFPFRPEFTLAELSGKRSVQVVRLLKGWRIGRALELEGAKYADATLDTKPELLKRYFTKPFTIAFWFKLAQPDQPLMSLTRNGRDAIRIRTTALGQVNIVRVDRDEAFVATNSLFSDGIWHHLLLSLDSTHKLRLFIDAQLFSTTDAPPEVFKNIDGLSLGDAHKPVSLWIDELHLLGNAIERTSDFEVTIVSAARDTLSNAFAIFHFNDFGHGPAHSSVPVFDTLIPSKDSNEEAAQEPTAVPISFALDSNAQIADASSPVQTDEVVLNADMVSPTQVNIGWRTTTELGVKNYVLEQRLGDFGTFEKVLTLEAKHGMKTAKLGASIIYRNSYATEQHLPPVRGEVELFYRIAIVGFVNDTAYSEPVKIEYGGDRDVFVSQNDPNPFNPTTQITFRLEKPSFVNLTIYDIIGRQITNLVNTKLEAGKHTYQFDGTNWAGGIYFYRVKTNGSTVTRKMVLAK